MYIGLHLKYRLFVSDVKENLNILDRFSKNTLISNFMKLSPMGDELFQVDRRMDGHDEINSLFFATLRKRQNKITVKRT